MAAKETWERSSIPLPLAGFSRNSVFLNIHYLIACSKKRTSQDNSALRFPWFLWQIWKARNAFCFERVRYEAEAIVSKADEDAIIWTQLQRHDQEEPSSLSRGMLYRRSWEPPPLDMIKCNVGVSWRSGSQVSGSAWIIRDSQGQAISHSRRSYSACRSLTEAGLNALFWAVEAVKNMRMNKIILEVSSPEVYEIITNSRCNVRRCALTDKVLHQLSSINHYHLTYVHVEANQVAEEIALSVTRDTRLQSYVAHGGPAWLRTLILKEAEVSAIDEASGA
ncbi:uncharacterized protein LOC125608687 [Brassica napus]|uniref:uncharacterized protein LOC125608687 n=1 Tax=Brassica napus TaxID=3708 RepID=UPI002078FE4A|nr:uncharacterized protein LOC125608687 [Brassica napus]